ncbi:MAG: MFS transporter [Steroidobacteraceae bacterium]
MPHNASAGPACSAATRWHVLVAGFLCYGFDAVDFMVLALALPAIIAEWHLSLGEAGLIGTAGMIGVGVSGVLMGWLADNHGRRRALLLSVCVFAVFTAALALARNRWDAMALRFLAGLGLGGVWGVVAALVAEVWSPERRGRAIAAVLSAWPVGVAAAALLAGALLPAHGWRVLFLCGGAALLAALYVWLCVPESAAWRAERERERARAAAVAPAAGKTAPARKQAGRVAIREIFAPGLRRNTLLGTLAAACALTGYWGANTWLPTYLVRERGLDAAAMARYVLLLNAGMFAGYQLLGWLSDRIGKRRALLVCFTGATLLLPLYAGLRDPRLLLWCGPLLALFFAYAGPFGAYFPELYPTRVRSLGSGFCFNVGRGIAAFAPFALGALATRYSLSTAIALSAVGFLCAGLVMLALPEADGVP